MKEYEVEIISREIYLVEAETKEEAEKLAINECGILVKYNEVDSITVREVN